MANFYCEFCGIKFPSVSNLTIGWCSKHPDGNNKGHHKLYEGSEKSQYICKYCGAKASNITSLTTGWCPKHPKGNNKGHHAPAL